jgi:hypothetical protein
VTNRTLYIVACGAPPRLSYRRRRQGRQSQRLGPLRHPTEAALPRLADQDLGDAPVITGNRTPDQPKQPHRPTLSP